ncbi:hypothetical protein KI688_009582 [Linnemannia hyalina]|uniref:D-arabinono-1,4-lactone oxidase C-terminal domain-containing protein n=1 Tax=Linnemannia hyalina TaxID=64524 RepID=A0A9P7Y016_9FUNG|nr:hypothetical protein KI688_009582 [Linnemannia hyalina]
MADNAEAFNIACLNLGLLGIIYTATIKVQPMSDYRLRAIDYYEPLETFFGDEPDAGLKLKELMMTNDSTELIYWPTARFMKHERNEHFWLKQWRRTTDPVEDSDKCKDQLPTVRAPEFVESLTAVPPSKVDSNFRNVVEGDEEAVLCVIKVMGSKLVPGFLGFSGEVLGAWMNKYNAKRHWAKQWEHISGVIPMLWGQYKDRLDVFNQIRRTQDPFDMFVNDTWRPLNEVCEE